MSPELRSFTIEAWTYFGISILLIGLRFGLRWRWLGFRGLAMDDFLMILAGIFYAIESVAAHLVGSRWQGLANSGMTDEQRTTLDPDSEEMRLRIHGSQTHLVGWIFYTSVLWTLKLCWLFFFKRLGDGVKHMALKINLGFAFVITTYLVCILTLLCSCWPIQRRWQINPDPGNICYPAVARVQSWMVVLTNLMTDFYIMSIPLPMVWNARIPQSKKASLIFMFSGGIITAVFGGLRCGFILQGAPNAPQQAGEWSVRETFVAMIVTNIPIMSPLIKRGVSRVRTGYSSRSGTDDRTPAYGRDSRGFKLSSVGQKVHSKSGFRPGGSISRTDFYDRDGSEVRIVEDDGHSVKEHGGRGQREDIVVTTQWNIETHRASADKPQASETIVTVGGKG